MGNKGNLSYLYILNSGILQTCRTCTLSHTHTRTCVHARVEFVFATPHFDQLSAFGHTFQQRVHRACRNSYLFSFVDGFVAGEAQGKAVEQGFGSHVRRWCGGGSCGQERENVACMAVQRFHQGQHGIKVVGADGEVELRYDSVCYVFLWNMGRRGQSGTVQQGTHDIFLWFTAPFASRQQGFQRAQQGDNAYDAEDIDGNTGYGAFHLVAVNGGGLVRIRGQSGS